MSYENIYYNPEKFGLKIFAELDVSSGYDFDKFVIWTSVHEGVAGHPLLWGYDSGCSCPAPFESFKLTDLDTGGIQSCLRALQQWYAARNDDGEYGSDYVRLLERLIQL